MELVRKPTRIYWARGTDPNTFLRPPTPALGQTLLYFLQHIKISPRPLRSRVLLTYFAQLSAKNLISSKSITCHIVMSVIFVIDCLEPLLRHSSQSPIPSPLPSRPLYLFQCIPDSSMVVPNSLSHSHMSFANSVFVRVYTSSPINPDRLSNQCHIGADRCTPTLPR